MKTKTNTTEKAAGRQKFELTVRNPIGESVRGFHVLVFDNRRKRPLLYPATHGEAALKCMETLTRRGFRCIAATITQGEEEHLELDEMREIFA